MKFGLKGQMLLKVITCHGSHPSQVLVFLDLIFKTIYNLASLRNGASKGF